jgi:hypothetical protein
VRENHNADLAGETFGKLPEKLRARILAYEFSVHVLPTDVEDQEVLEMFARLNATGTKLNHQELRNSGWFGEFKTSMYRLALEQLDRWRAWKIFSDDQISRMREVEATSDFAMSMIKGLSGKSQQRLDAIYEEFNEEFAGQNLLEARFRQTMDEIEALLGQQIANSVYSSEVHFFSLFVYIYDLLWGLGSKLHKRAAAKLPKHLSQRLLEVGEKFETGKVPGNVLDAVQRASADYGRRKTRLEFIKKQVHA